MQPTDHEVAIHMARTGGGFAANLAKTWMVADAHHRALITSTFPSMWDAYRVGLIQMQQREEVRT